MSSHDPPTPRPTQTPSHYTHLAATHPLSTAFLMGAALTLSALAGARAATAALAPRRLPRLPPTTRSLSSTGGYDQHLARLERLVADTTAAHARVAAQVEALERAVRTRQPLRAAAAALLGGAVGAALMWQLLPSTTESILGEHVRTVEETAALRRELGRAVAAREERMAAGAAKLAETRSAEETNALVQELERRHDVAAKKIEAGRRSLGAGVVGHGARSMEEFERLNENLETEYAAEVARVHAGQKALGGVDPNMVDVLAVTSAEIEQLAQAIDKEQAKLATGSRSAEETDALRAELAAAVEAKAHRMLAAQRVHAELTAPASRTPEQTAALRAELEASNATDVARIEAGQTAYFMASLDPRRASATPSTRLKSEQPVADLGINDTGEWKFRLLNSTRKLPAGSAVRSQPIVLSRRSERGDRRAAPGATTNPPFWFVSSTTLTYTIGPFSTPLVYAPHVDMVLLDGAWWRVTREGEVYTIRGKVADDV